MDNNAETIYGCAIGDKEKLSILSKAGECRPPVGLEVFVENEDTDKPFYRIEIPSGPYKPYCTNKGIWEDLEDFNRRIHGQLDDISYIAENSSSHPDNTISKSQNIAS